MCKWEITVLPTLHSNVCDYLYKSPPIKLITYVIDTVSVLRTHVSENFLVTKVTCMYEVKAKQSLY